MLTCLKSLMKQLRAFDANDVYYQQFKAADLIFDGDIAKWKKWGYSLMLRLAMRVSNVDADMADTYVTKAVAGGTMETNDDNAWVDMALTPSEWMNQNGISRTFYPGDGGVWQSNLLSKPLVDQLKGTNKLSTADDDPRLMIFTAGIIEWTASKVDTIENDPLLQEGHPVGVNGSIAKCNVWQQSCNSLQDFFSC